MGTDRVTPASGPVASEILQRLDRLERMSGRMGAVLAGGGVPGAAVLLDVRATLARDLEWADSAAGIRSQAADLLTVYRVRVLKALRDLEAALAAWPDVDAEASGRAVRAAGAVLALRGDALAASPEGRSLRGG